MGKAAALRAATLHPAVALGISEQKGTLQVGADADFVLLDDSFNVCKTYIAGELVWQAGPQADQASKEWQATSPL